MTKHKLRYLILNSLEEAPNSGYGLIKIIEEATEWRPSYGSVYPLLEKLRGEGLVTFKEKGRRKIYTLTKAGREIQESEVSDNHKKVAQKLTETHHIMSHLLGIDKDESDEIMGSFITALLKGDLTFKEFMPASMRMKKAFWKLYKERRLKKNKKEVLKIFNDASERLERLR